MSLLRIALLLLALCTISWWAMADPRTRPEQDRIEAYIRKRMEEATARKIRECRDQAILKASILVDSLLTAQALYKDDTLSWRYIPAKPGRPRIRVPKDSLPLRPLFHDSIFRLRSDTSGRK